MPVLKQLQYLEVCQYTRSTITKLYNLEVCQYPGVHLSSYITLKYAMALWEYPAPDVKLGNASLQYHSLKLKIILYRVVIILIRSSITTSMDRVGNEFETPCTYLTYMIHNILMVSLQCSGFYFFPSLCPFFIVFYSSFACHLFFCDCLSLGFCL